ncbi:MAG: AbrB/MazE/SpoVT family DNA-binding domain-containing protein [Puniceicoccales bacterium]|jgi:virulence-associated protein VagC|nr:AbrB/MazE/SpoVT family DNA-binding domain-containing protein [Puniceicoccales bacterium]
METKIFKNGQFQAVRIPKAYRLSGTVCEISKRGDTLIIKNKHSVNWSQFFDTYAGAPDFEIERNHVATRTIEI